MGGGLDEIRADHQVDFDVLPGFDALGQIAAPRFEAIDPALNSVKIFADVCDAEFGAPAVIAGRSHSDAAPIGIGSAPVEQTAGNGIVAIGEDIGFDRNGFACDTLYGESPGINFGADIFNDDTPSSVDLFQIHHVKPALFELSNMFICALRAALPSSALQLRAAMKVP